MNSSIRIIIAYILFNFTCQLPLLKYPICYSNAISPNPLAQYPYQRNYEAVKSREFEDHIHTVKKIFKSKSMKNNEVRESTDDVNEQKRRDWSISKISIRVINLAIREDRWNKWKSFDSHGDFRRFEAIDRNDERIDRLIEGKSEFSLKLSDMSRLALVGKQRRSHDEFGTRSAVACFLSHYNVWLDFLNEDNPSRQFLFVLEDDAILPFPYVHNDLHEASLGNSLAELGMTEQDRDFKALRRTDERSKEYIKTDSSIFNEQQSRSRKENRETGETLFQYIDSNHPQKSGLKEWDIWLIGYNRIRQCYTEKESREEGRENENQRNINNANEPFLTKTRRDEEGSGAGEILVMKSVNREIEQSLVVSHPDLNEGLLYSGTPRWLDVRQYWGAHAYILSRKAVQELVQAARNAPIMYQVEAFISLQAQLKVLRIIAHSQKTILWNGTEGSDVDHVSNSLCDLGSKHVIFIAVLYYFQVIIMISVCFLPFLFISIYMLPKRILRNMKNHFLCCFKSKHAYMQLNRF